MVRKAHMLESFFNKVADLQSEILLNERLHQIFFNSKDLNSNFNNSILINIIGMLYMHRNVDFVFDIFRTSVLQLSYYKNNFQPQKQLFYIFKISLHMVFIKRNSLKSKYFLFPYLFHFFRIHAFQGPGFYGSRFQKQPEYSRRKKYECDCTWSL